MIQRMMLGALSAVFAVAAHALAHMMDPYRQSIEYLRMNGIVPPASRTSSMEGN